MEQDMTAGDGDGRLKRAGTVWTTSARITAAVIGSGVLPLAWAMAQLGWIAGPTMLFLFSFVMTYYTSCLLAKCNRCGDLVTGKRNYTYVEAIENILGGYQVKLCGFVLYLYLIGVAIDYSVTASVSMLSIKNSICFQVKGHGNLCRVSGTPYMFIMFGIVQILLSQIPDFHQISWLSMMSAVMSITYTIIDLGLAICKVIQNGKIEGSLTGISIGKVNQKILWVSQALGAIVFAYSYSLILIETQDTIKSPPAEHKTMKKATLISAATTTVIYMLCGCFGYAAFSDMRHVNLLTGFGFHNPYWQLVDIANVAIFVHHVGAYQVYCQPLFAIVESTAARCFPESKFINNNIEVPIPFGGYQPYKLNMFKLVWRTVFVCMTTIISMLIMPFYNDAVGILGAFGFYLLTVYFPVKIYIAQKKIPKWSSRWVLLQILSIACLIMSVFAAAGSFAGVITDLKVYEPFKTMY